MRKSVKIVLIIIFVLVISGGVTLVLLNHYDKEAEELEESLLYSDETIELLKEYNIYDEVAVLDYSKTLETVLLDGTYNSNYLDDYMNIEYLSISGFSDTINSLLSIGYDYEEINYILSDMYDSLDIIISMEYFDVVAFSSLSNFRIANLERYINYQKENDYDAATTVTYVNIGLDQEGYSNYTEYTVDEASDITVLVNKYQKLPDDYEPSDLTYISGTNYQLRAEAASAFEELQAAALLDNVIIYPYSAYRSYSLQNTLYYRYVANDGQENADTYSARPGFSEHQLGLAVDIRSSSLSSNLTDEDYEWMQENAYKYGFIIRYPKGKQSITQYIEEPWHLRYLGVELATKVYESGLTYDEYYDLYMTEA